MGGMLMSKQEQDQLREWLKDYIVSYITEEGKSQRRVRDHFVFSGFITKNDDWNTTPVEMKKFIFRTALEQLKRDNVIRQDLMYGNVNHRTFLVVNNVLDILSKMPK